MLLLVNLGYFKPVKRSKNAMLAVCDYASTCGSSLETKSTYFMISLTFAATAVPSFFSASAVR
jgi:hypothetical protein